MPTHTVLHHQLLNLHQSTSLQDLGITDLRILALRIRHVLKQRALPFQIPQTLSVGKLYP